MEFLRGSALSKKLLLPVVMRDDNVANNGGTSIRFWYVDNYYCIGS